MKEEAQLLQKSEISGGTLTMVDRACLRDINITSVGKQLTILRCIQELLSKGDL